jgi:hypothetical protein
MQAAIIDGRAATLQALQIQQKPAPAARPTGVLLSLGFKDMKACIRRTWLQWYVDMAGLCLDCRHESASAAETSSR